MLVAKVAAASGLALLFAGAAGAGGSSAIVAGCLLFLVAAVIGAVILEGRDVAPAAALRPPVDDEQLVAQPSVAPAELPTAA